MTLPTYSSFAQWYEQGDLASYVRARKSAGGILSIIEAAQPAGDMSDPAVPDLVLHQDLIGGTRVSGDLGAGAFDVTSDKGGFFLAKPNFANKMIVDSCHQFRSLALPLSHWQSAFDEANVGAIVLDRPEVFRGSFKSPEIRAAIRCLWAICADEGVPSRLLARAAGYEIISHLCRLGGASPVPAKGGLSSWAKRRCIELMHARLSEDISMEELADEAQLSPFHFARMFKQSLGVPPRVYLTQLRMEKACELLEHTDIPITEIAFEVGYSSNQVLARVFNKNRHMSPTEYRRAVREPGRTIEVPRLKLSAHRDRMIPSRRGPENSWKREKPEDIVLKLRQVEVLAG
ncbi:transcriptional regulator, AraC family [Palleronia marisminoris]|uniref:HTH-type transcriptional regulator YesS n=1 Tax=Palleronia marisminoris TaxID=315423 RepID=A0A1Y5TZA8_9RHOB|nr:AraC family transcriptional regulator [Palleronia marisminoris]SFH54985.1 transcriptional regulator, AraC family [Palleronia marisminoris]SLN71924.1 HTH-type transcriptional regulator YesS [Palleronia marisminoris]